MIGWADAANAVALFVAATGLAIAVHDAGVPSLGQGAFVGAAAFTTAALRAHAGWDPATAAVAGVVVAGLTGCAVAVAVARLTPAFTVLASWIVAWLFVLVTGAFPRVLGGSAGVAVGPARFRSPVLGRTVGVGARGWFVVAALIAAALVTAVAGVRRRYGPACALARNDVSAARAAGISVTRVRAGALIASAIVGGIAGTILVQVAQVADPSRYGPVLSLQLLVVVILGGRSLAGPAVGLVGLTAIDRLASAFASALGPPSTVVEPMAAGVLLIVVLVARGTGRAVNRRRAAPPARARDATGSGSGRTLRGAAVTARDVRVRFGGVDALDGVTITIPSGTCHAIVGPNGSGKTTLLRVLAGLVHPDSGAVDAGTRAVRTLQRPDTADDTSLCDLVVAGMEPRRHTGILEAALWTPRACDEQRRCATEASEWLADAGVQSSPAQPLRTVPGGERRLVQIARIVAARPDVVLLDEPSAGMAAPDEEQLVAFLGRLKAGGLTIVLVEHNLRVVAAVADRVTVLSAGAVIAEGGPDDVVRDTRVQSVYLGELAEHA